MREAPSLTVVRGLLERGARWWRTTRRRWHEARALRDLLETGAPTLPTLRRLRAPTRC
jgi:hypothetical protein